VDGSTAWMACAFFSMFSSAFMGWGLLQSTLSEFQSMSTMPHLAAHLPSTCPLLLLLGRASQRHRSQRQH
jgi:hypothetical protein